MINNRKKSYEEVQDYLDEWDIVNNDLESLINQGEGYTLEFKKAFSNSIGKEICAFANSKGGKIILGVNDKGEIVGFSLTNSDKSRILDLNSIVIRKE